MDVDAIVRRVLAKGPKREDVAAKYQSTDQSAKEVHLVNYQLQVENSDLSKQLKKLKRMLKVKTDHVKTNASILSEIAAAKDQLRQILNLNQTLELSLSKVRASRYQSSVSHRNRTDQSLSSGSRDCNCARNKAMAENSHQNHSQVIDQSQNVPKIFVRSPQKKPGSSLLPSGETRNTGIQTHDSYFDAKCKIDSKKQYRQKLTQLVAKQEQMINQYSKRMAQESKVGQITKASTLKNLKISPSLGSIVRTGAKCGSIVKTKR